MRKAVMRSQCVSTRRNYIRYEQKDAGTKLYADTYYIYYRER